MEEKRVVWQFLQKRIDTRQKVWKIKTNIIISHNRILEVEKIEDKEIKEGWKLNENENYRILDKDYWKSEELMRQLLEKKKKVPFWLFLLMIIFGGVVSIIIMIMTYNILMSYISPPVEAPKKNPIPLVQNEIKVTPKNEVKEEKVIIDENKEFEKIKHDYEALEIAYFEELEKTCENTEVIKEVEKPLTQKEEFIMNLWKSILFKCDNLIKNSINDKETETCKNLYAKYILTIK